MLVAEARVRVTAWKFREGRWWERSMWGMKRIVGMSDSVPDLSGACWLAGVLAPEGVGASSEGMGGSCVVMVLEGLRIVAAPKLVVPSAPDEALFLLILVWRSGEADSVVDAGFSEPLL